MRSVSYNKNITIGVNRNKRYQNLVHIFLREICNNRSGEQDRALFKGKQFVRQIFFLNALPRSNSLTDFHDPYVKMFNFM